MSIPAINEQLLRAIGVGIAIVGEDKLEGDDDTKNFLVLELLRGQELRALIDSEEEGRLGVGR